jgi:hypothetical protein
MVKAPQGSGMTLAHSYGVEMNLKEFNKYRQRWFEVYATIRAWHHRDSIGFGTRVDDSGLPTGR